MHSDHFHCFILTAKSRSLLLPVFFKGDIDSIQLFLEDNIRIFLVLVADFSVRVTQLYIVVFQAFTVSVPLPVSASLYQCLQAPIYHPTPSLLWHIFKLGCWSGSPAFNEVVLRFRYVHRPYTTHQCASVHDLCPWLNGSASS